MKKSICIFLSVCTALLTFSGCVKKENKNLIKLCEVTHSVFYAPLYVAIEKGFFKEEGIDVELTTGGGADSCMTALLSKSSDMSFMGPEASIYVNIEGRKDKPVVIAQLTKRDGSFLISRKEEKSFKWTDLKGSEIIAGRKGGVPAMTLEYVLSQNGLHDGIDVTLNYDVQFSLTAAAFMSDKIGDYVTMFEPTATECQNQGKGYIVASVGEASGEVPYTAFTVLSSYLKTHEEQVEKFIRAIYKALDFVEKENSDVIAEVLQPQFVGTAKESLKASVDSYKKIDAWVHNTAMTKDSFDRLQTIMEQAGELSMRVQLTDIVDNTLSNKVYSEIYG